MTNFKPGDWAVCPEDNKIFLIDGDYNGGYQSTEYWSGLDFILWQPQPNEWCWFWCVSDFDAPILSRFCNMKDNLFTCTNSKQILFTHCEPFIGQLPTILKDE